MRAELLIAITALAVSCQSGPVAAPATSQSPVALGSSSSPASSTPTSGPSCQPASAYGLLIVAGTLQVVDTCAKVKTSAPLAAPSVQACSPGGVKANLEPPVSATADRVYYRDGDTKIRYLTPDGQSADVTTVPGSATSVSFFSVSPDDQRIAVLVEDLSPASTVNLRLYVEDVQGGGHHADIYSAAISKSQGDTLWPMGWHGGQLVLAVIAACSDATGGVSPDEWHLVDPATGNRTVTINGICQAYDTSGILSRWPSPAGVVCADFGFALTVENWSGTVTGNAHQSENANDIQTGVSPSGRIVFNGGETSQQECGASAPSTCIQTVTDATPFVFLPAQSVACLFIDDAHLLTPQGVINLLGRTSNSFGITLAPLLLFPASGACAGRFPGGL